VEAPSKTKRWTWQWIIAGMIADLVGFCLVPAYDWEGQPLKTWMTLILFPYWMLWSDWAPFYHSATLRIYDTPSRYFFYFAPLPIYGALIAVVSRTSYVRLRLVHACGLHHFCWHCRCKVLRRMRPTLPNRSRGCVKSADQILDGFTMASLHRK
jgi:hypothetical protein